MTELRGLTGLRGVAAWLVVLYHIRLTIAGLPPVVERVLAKGYLAVDFFFLLSGFVIWLAWHERFARDRWRAAPNFLLRRFARVWPLHALMLVAAVMLAGALALAGRATPQFPADQFPVNLLLLQTWGLADRLTWNDPAWSISAEAGAYLLFPVLTLAVSWRRVPTPMILVALAALFGLLHAAMAGAPTLGTDIVRFGLLRCVVEFAAGTALAALWLRRNAAMGPIALVCGVALLAGWWAGLPETLAIPAAFAALLLALAIHDRANPLGRAIPHALGEASYATYLGHFLLFYVFKLLLVDDPRAIPPTLIALYLLATLVGSFALYHLFERPAQRLVMALPGRLRARALSPPARSPRSPRPPAPPPAPR